MLVMNNTMYYFKTIFLVFVLYLSNADSVFIQLQHLFQYLKLTIVNRCCNILVLDQFLIHRILEKLCSHVAELNDCFS